MNYENIKTLKKQVGFCLENFPETRDSDAELITVVCTKFTHNAIEKASSIERCRRWFNHRNQYLPRLEEIARKRKINLDEWRVAMGYPTKETERTPHPSWTPPSLKSEPQPESQQKLIP